MKPRNLIILLPALAALAMPAAAHHGSAAYSRDYITVEATITDFRFVNPHVQLYFDIANADGETEHWQAELTAPNRLARAGWTKNTFKPGDNVQISGFAALNGGHSIRVRELILDGETLPLSENVFE